MEFLEDGDHFKKLLLNWKDNEGNSLLHIFIKNLNLKDVVDVLRKGVDASPLNSKRESPLHTAASLMDKDASLNFIKCLLESGADASAKDLKNRTFLHIIAQNNESSLSPSKFHEIADYLIGQGHAKLFEEKGWFNGATPFQWATANIELEERTLLLFKKSGLDFSVINEYKNNLISYAIFGHRSSTLISNLIRFGADKFLLNRENANFRHIAAEIGNLEAVRLFTKEGLHVNWADFSGNTPLHSVLAFSNENVLEIANCLVEGGASVNRVNKKGISPLDYARERDDLEMIPELIGVLTRNFDQ